ncbi:MAG: patatin-like phospholipase family protein [Gemmatimonadaceae bacterium]
MLPSRADARVVALAKRWRRGFDRWAGPLSPSAIAIGGVILIALVSVLVAKATTRFGGCTAADTPISPLRLQATFDALRFASLVRAEGACASTVELAFWLDIAFAAAYGFALPLLFIWTERWRRCRFDAQDTTRIERLPIRQHFILVAPVVAALLDIFPEDIPLGFAAYLARHDVAAGWLGALVVVGSIGASLKWLVLLYFAWGLAAEFLAGPRGLVLRMLRYSALGAALLTLPLLVIAQGQEVLQRVAESAHFVAAAIIAIASIVFVALSVWYLGRALVYLEAEDIEAVGGYVTATTPWYRYFAEYIPRIVGTAVLAVASLAFAKVGLAVTPFVVALVASGVIVFRAQRPRAGETFHDFAHRQRNAARWAAAVSAVFCFAWTRVFPTDAALNRLTVTSGVTIGCAWLFYAYVQYRRARDPNSTSDQRSSDALGVGGPAGPNGLLGTHRPQLVPLALAGIALSLAVMVTFAISDVVAGRVLGPLALLSIAAANAVFFGTMLIRFGTRYRFPVVRFAIVMAMLFSVWNDNHLVATMERASDSARVAARPTLTQRYQQWLAAPRPDSGGPIILVATSGGGLRAAYWTAAVLAAIQDSNPAFAHHVFAISGVSGGSLGAALFVSLARDDAGAKRLTCDDTSTTRHFTGCVRRYMRDDFLSPVLSKMLAPDFAQRFLPFVVREADRSAGVEQSWAASYKSLTGHDTFRQGVLDLTAADSRTELPVLLMNSTHVESGRRYVASPVSFGRELGDAGDVLAKLNADLPLASAIHNSARFTFVSPPGRLGNTDTLGRVVDGGYFENSGLATIQEVYLAIRKDAELRQRPIIVVYLCNDPLQCAHDRRAAVPDTGAAALRPDSATRVNASWGNEIFGPVHAVLNARDARGSLARAQLEHALYPNHVLQLNVCDHQVFRSKARQSLLIDSAAVRERAQERAVSPPLGWLLSELARAWMDSSASLVPKLGDRPCRQQNLAAINTLMAALPR